MGLVLGAGGLVGHAWHSGVLAALSDETGWDARSAHVIVGTSAGAGISSYLRAGVGGHELVDRLGRPPGSRSHSRLVAVQTASRGEPDPASRRRRPLSPGMALRSAVPPWHARAGVVLTGLVPEGRRSTAPIADWSLELHGDDWPTLPLWLCAVDVATGRRVVFGRHTDLPDVTVARAVEASCAVPTVFAPVEIGDRRFVDGAVHSPTNADLLTGQGVDIVVVSSPMSASSGSARIGPRAYHHRLLQNEIELLRADGVESVRLEPAGDVLAELRRARGAGPEALAAVAALARDSVAAHLRRPEVADRLRLLPAAELDSAGTTDFR